MAYRGIRVWRWTGTGQLRWLERGHVGFKRGFMASSSLSALLLNGF